MTTLPSQPSLLETIARKREPAGYVLLAVGALMLGLAIFFGIRWESARGPDAPPSDEQVEIDIKKENKPTDRGDYLPAAIWSGLIAALCVVGGVLQLTRKPAPGTELHETRLTVVALGGAIGLLTALLGFALAWRWKESLLVWVNKDDVQEARWVLAALAIFLGGIAVMFFGMQPARAEERSSVVLRRMLYGTNAVLTGLLLLLMLVVVNVVVFMKLPDNVVTTAAGFKGLSPTSKEFLRTIKEPVKVYLIMSQNHVVETGAEPYRSLYSDCRALLRDCESENKNITSIHLSPTTDDDEIKKVMKRYKVPESKREQFGMLVAYGDNDEFFEYILAREMLTFIPDRGSRQGGRIAFQGENRFMTELNFLSGGAKRPVVYFTQSNGEPSIGGGPADSSPRTARALVQHLKERKYDLKPLVFQPGKKLDLSDAEIVVVGAPNKPFTVEEAHILREYLAPKKDGRRGGKLVAMLPAFPDLNGKVSATGLEILLSEFGISVEPNKRILGFPQPVFEREAGVKIKYLVPGNFAPALRRSKHPLTDLIRPNDAILFAKLRRIQQTRTAMPQGMHGAELFATVFNWPTYRDEKYDSDPEEIDALVRKETAASNGVSKTFDEKEGDSRPVSIGAYVAEVVGEGEQAFERPRVVVIGSDSFIDDESIRQSRNPNQNINVMGQLFEWIRERPEGMKIEPQSLGTYSLPERPDIFALVYLPTGLIVMGIMALGIGVWVTRRT